jgi:hypothetical protein
VSNLGFSGRTPEIYMIEGVIMARGPEHNIRLSL